MLQCDPVQELHDDERLTFVLGHLVYHADIRMAEGRSRLRLTLETSQSLGVSGDFVRQKLQGDKPVQGYVLGFVHYPHSAATELLDDAVVRDRLANHRRESYVAEAGKSMKA